MGTLYIVATPIGNLEDITERALRVLREADLVVCEDTRVTHKLLDHYNIKTSTISYHQHSNRSKTNTLISLLRENKTLALVTDAGTPGIQRYLSASRHSFGLAVAAGGQGRSRWSITSP